MAQHVMAVLNHRTQESHAMQKMITQLDARLHGIEIREHQKKATATTHIHDDNTDGGGRPGTSGMAFPAKTYPATMTDNMGVPQAAEGAEETPLMKRFRSLNWKNTEM